LVLFGQLVAWAKVLYGFFGSLVLGFLLGYGLTKLIEFSCRKLTRGVTTRFFTKAQIVSAGAMSVVHGIQDGAKFIGIFIMLAAMLGGQLSIPMLFKPLGGFMFQSRW
jgi:PiT family inorganic phosphate transporter